MAYFRENDPEETRLQPPVRNSKEAQYDTQEYVDLILKNRKMFLN